MILKYLIHLHSFRNILVEEGKNMFTGFGKKKENGKINISLIFKLKLN